MDVQFVFTHLFVLDLTLTSTVTKWLFTSHFQKPLNKKLLI